MDIQHLKYAVEVERARSISRAAEKLYLSQPFLSKTIREMENEVGFSIFSRSSRGVVPTKKGEEFLARARELLAGFEDLESTFRVRRNETFHFEITVPIACYVSEAFVGFVRELADRELMRIDYRETNTMSTIGHVADGDCNLGIIRYQSNFEEYFLRYVESKDLIAKPIWEFEYHLVMSRLNPLANRETVTAADLKDLIEISHGDPTVPSLSASTMLEMKRREASRREIVVYERQSQFELLCALPETYMWASPTPRSIFDTYPLVQKTCDTPENHYKDVLIYRKGYRLTAEDRLFIQKVNQVVDSFRSRDGAV